MSCWSTQDCTALTTGPWYPGKAAFLVMPAEVKLVTLHKQQRPVSQNKSNYMFRIYHVKQAYSPDENRAGIHLCRQPFCPQLPRTWWLSGRLQFQRVQHFLLTSPGASMHVAHIHTCRQARHSCTQRENKYLKNEKEPLGRKHVLCSQFHSSLGTFRHRLLAVSKMESEKAEPEILREASPALQGSTPIDRDCNLEFRPACKVLS